MRNIIKLITDEVTLSEFVIYNGEDIGISNNITLDENECTEIMLDVCKNNYIDKFVLVSTDKAVRSTNIMGSTKRICELIRFETW